MSRRKNMPHTTKIVKDLKSTLEWIIERIEQESEKTLSGSRPEWKRAAIESVEEAYASLGRIKEF